MKKLDARSIADLVRLAIAAGEGDERKIAGDGLTGAAEAFLEASHVGTAPSTFGLHARRTG